MEPGELLSAEERKGKKKECKIPMEPGKLLSRAQISLNGSDTLGGGEQCYFHCSPCRLYHSSFVSEILEGIRPGIRVNMINCCRLYCTNNIYPILTFTWMDFEPHATRGQICQLKLLLKVNFWDGNHSNHMEISFKAIGYLHPFVFFFFPNYPRWLISS